MALLGKILGALRRVAKSLLSGNGQSEGNAPAFVAKEEKAGDVSVRNPDVPAVVVDAPKDIPPAEIPQSSTPKAAQASAQPIADFKSINLLKDNDGYTIEADGEIYSLYQFSRKFNINFSTLYGRIQKGWNIQEIIKVSRPVKRDYKKSAPIKAKLWEFNGEKHSVSEWASIYGVTEATMRRRLALDGSPERNTERMESYQTRRAKTYEWKGERHTVKEWAKIYNVPERTMFGRWEKHNSPEHIPNAYIPETAKLWEYNGEKHSIAEWAKILCKGESTLRHNFKATGTPYCLAKPGKPRPGTHIGVERTYTWNGVTKKTSEWAKEYNCTPNAVRKRFHSTGSPEVAGKGRIARIFTFNGESHTYKEWGEKYGISSSQVYKRIKKYGTIDPHVAITLSQGDPPEPNVQIARTKTGESPDADCYWCDGEWKTIAEWARVFGLPESEVKTNFELYGEPVKPTIELDCDTISTGESEAEIDAILAEVDRKNRNNKQKRESIHEWFERMAKEPDDGRPLREILGAERSYFRQEN